MTSPADSFQDVLFSKGPPVWLHRSFGLVGPVKPPHLARRALVTAAVAWFPTFVLAALGAVLHWNDTLGSFGTDVAFHVRSLIATPLLVIAEMFCAARLGGIVQHFLDAALVPETERPRFEAAVASTRRLRDSPFAEIMVELLAYGTTFALVRSVTGGPVWRLAESGPLPLLSPAGWWQALVSTPLLLALVFGWLWRVALWTRFLWLVAGMKLRLVPAHPDLTAGLKFVGYSVRAFVPVALGFSCVVAGTVANGVLVRGQPLVSFRFAVLALVVFMVVLFGGPPLVFTRTLLETWQRGVLQYSGIANALGREFEEKWFCTRRVDQSALDVQDFSATVDLYQVVSYVYEMNLFPIESKSLVTLVVASLVPFVPVVLVALPLDVILSKLAGLWL